MTPLITQNTRKYQKNKVQEINENRNIPVWCKHRNGKLPTTHSGKTGCLSMVLNQTQRATAASDWEPYQAKHRNKKPRLHNLEAHPNSRPDQTKTET